MTAQFFVITDEMRFAATQIQQAQARLDTQVAAFHSGPAAAARTNDALPSADIKGEYGTNLDQVNSILDKLTTALGNWATALSTAAEFYQKSDAVAAGTIGNSMPVSGEIGGQTVTAIPYASESTS